MVACLLTDLRNVRNCSPDHAYLLSVPSPVLPSRQFSHRVPIVNTTSGLRGFSPYPDVAAYIGIPYSQPPVGSLCCQFEFVTAFADHSTGIAESEDMFINIWKPSSSNSTALLPLVVFLYGGAFIQGTNGVPEYNGPSFVAEQDIIFACIK
ncbi:hypothetical protein BJ878DRAFT_67518 [Calycina marina]|uniref:Carboxylesterase type B domain-containing protein n=1 Tax=Calycina marina TaxID=1763456 RepID=A0A9P7Z2P0_9HELO|nr:hypothetical protein BJ878DRAFT_67518 [Calycina marina]